MNFPVHGTNINQIISVQYFAEKQSQIKDFSSFVNKLFLGSIVLLLVMLESRQICLSHFFSLNHTQSKFPNLLLLIYRAFSFDVFL